jgi:hypothetical protein
MTLRQQVYDTIAHNPGFTSKDVAEALNIEQVNASSTLNALHDDLQLTRQRKGRFFHYQISETVRAAPIQLGFSGYELELRARIAELEAWQAAALLAYPDLTPVDPLLIKAREIVAAECGGSTAGIFLDGARDDTVAVRAVLAALRSAAS